MAALAAGCASPPPLQGPYKHAPLALDRDTLLMRSEVAGPARPLAELVGPDAVVHWAFATGECGEERWGEGIDTERFARANVAAFVAAGRRYVVSTGGEGGQFRCGSDEGMARFIARYDSPMLVGIDLDIESGQTDADIDALVQRVKAAQRTHPRLRFSLTLPTHAGTDPPQGLNALGRRVMAAVRRHGLQDVVVNLMVMNYGDARAAHCVLKDTPGEASCDMGRSARQAARNLHAQWQVPLDRIAVTAMPGVNDVRGNLTTLEDARRIAAEAREDGLAGVHHWSLDRDRACPAPAPTGASPLCSGVDQGPLDFDRAFRKGLRR